MHASKVKQKSFIKDNYKSHGKTKFAYSRTIEKRKIKEEVYEKTRIYT